MPILTAGLLIIRNRKLLLAFSNNKKCFYLPGGKVDAGETAQEALCREILEELSVIIRPEELLYYTHISAPAFGESPAQIMEQDCFFLAKTVDPVPSSEIGDLRYFSFSEYILEETKAPGAVMILKQLREDGLID